MALVGENGVYRVYHSGDAGRNWSPSWPDLPGGLSVTALLAAADGVYVGSLMRGVFAAPYHCSGEPPVWRDVSGGLPTGVSVSALAAAGREIYVGTRGHGVFAHSSDEWRSMDSAGDSVGDKEAVTALAVADDGVLVGGTRALTRMRIGGGGRDAGAFTESTSAVMGIQVASPGRLLTWSSRRVWYSDDDGTSWLGLPRQPIDGGYIRSAAAIGSHVFAGVQGNRGAGVLRMELGADRWEKCGDGLPMPCWSVVVAAASGAVLAGLGSQGIYRLPVALESTAALSHAFTVEAEGGGTGPTVRFRLHRTEDIRLELSGPDGNCVRSFVLGPLPTGIHEVTVDDGSLAAGVYTCTVSSTGFSRSVRKIVLR